MTKGDEPPHAPGRAATRLDLSTAAVNARDRIRAGLWPLVDRAPALADALVREVGVSEARGLLPFAVRCAASARQLRRMVESALTNDASALQAWRSPTLAMSSLRHDVRSPISALRGFAEIIGDEGAANGLEAVAALAGKLGATSGQVLATAEATLAPHERTAWPSPSSGDAIEALAKAPEELTGRILVIDDDPSMQSLLAAQLRPLGHDLVAAASGIEGLERLRGAKFDLVLLDLVMPGMDGFETLERINADRDLRRVPTIVISGVEDQHAAVRCIQRGAVDILLKPVDSVLLRARIAASLARNRWQDVEAKFRERLDIEKRRFEAFVLGILPSAVVRRLMAGESVGAHGA